MTPFSKRKAKQTPWVSLLNQALPLAHNPGFIANDPMQFAHQARGDWHRCELAAFIAAVTSYGQRPVIINTLNTLWQRLGNDPWQALHAMSEGELRQALSGLLYRFYKTEDWVWLLQRLAKVYHQHGSLQALWLASNAKQPKASLQQQMAGFTKALQGEEPRTGWRYGQGYFLPKATKNGACKRLHLFLRWVVRNDEHLSEPVDFGLWQEALTPTELLIPLDTHVGRLARHWGWITSNANTWAQAEAITSHLRQLNPNDPTVYDFALMYLGLEGSVI